MHEVAFPAVEPSSPVHDALEPLRELIATDPGVPTGSSSGVRAEVLPRRTSSGDAELSRCYWSVQSFQSVADGADGYGFAARTLHWDRRTRQARVVEFPDEPVMDWLVGPEGALSSHGEQARVHVLRYIPLRRVTFALEQAPDLPARVIAKTKRRRSILRATRALLGARQAVARGHVDAFRVPPPVGLDARRRLLYLAEVPGRSLSELLASGHLDRGDALHRLGGIHRAVHELDVHRIPVRRSADWLAATATAADQIGILVPSVRRPVAALVDRLRRTMPDDTDFVFCQGDFVPSQILCDPSGWTVLDFDDAHHADPHAEVAALSVALGWELSHATAADADAARRAYLAGYGERAGGPLDPARWDWYIAVARVRYLARRLVKGRAPPGEAAAVLDEVGTGPSGALDAFA